LTSAQQQQLGLDRFPTMNNQGTDSLGNRGCVYDKTGANPRFGYMITPVTQEGVDVWLREKRNVEVRQISVAGYGAVITQLGSRQKVLCNVVVDVAQGQSLDVQFTAITPDVFTRDQVCEKAADGAQLAVQTLQAMR
jgi:hypothetical protein